MSLEPVYSATLYGASGSLILRTNTNVISAELQAVILDTTVTRAVTVASASTITPNIDQYDLVVVSALAENLTIANPSPITTLVEGQRLVIRVKDDGTSMDLSFGNKYRGLAAVLPAETTVDKTMYMGFIYNSTDDKWDLLAYANQL